MMRNLLVALLGLCATQALAAPAYRPAGAVPLGDPPFWDYTVVDPITGRVYVAHGDKLAVIDGELVGITRATFGGGFALAGQAAGGDGGFVGGLTGVVFREFHGKKARQRQGGKDVFNLPDYVRDVVHFFPENFADYYVRLKNLPAKEAGCSAMKVSRIT